MPDDKTRVLKDAEIIEEQLKAFDRMADSYTAVTETVGVLGDAASEKKNMEDPAMQEIRKLAGYQEFREKMKKIAEKTAEFYRLDDDGSFHKADNNDITELLGLYNEAYTGLNTFLKGMNDYRKNNEAVFKASPLVSAFSGIMDYTKEMLEKDIPLLSGLNTREPVDLRREIIGNRTAKITVKNGYNTIGANSSTRIPIVYTDTDGKVHKGFFTIDEKIAYTEDLKEGIEAAKLYILDNPRWKASIPDSIRKIFSDFMENVMSIPELYNDPGRLFMEVLNPGDQETFDKKGNKLSEFRPTALEEHIKDNFQAFAEKYPPEKYHLPHPWGWRDGLTDEEQKKVSEFIKTTKVSGSFNMICSKFTRVIIQTIINKSKAFTQCYPKQNYIQINQLNNTSVTQRNCAMSAVANLLGIGHVIAHSANTKITIGKTEADGVFMENGVGEDLRLATSETLLGKSRAMYSGKKGAKPQKEILAGSAKKDLYTLQALDYICNNVDRHLSNMLYKVDENTLQVTGIQGIDNDMSFGTEVPDPDKKVVLGHLATVNNLLFIPRGLADRILALDPATLDLTLKGFDLHEREINAACERLKQVQEALRDGRIKALSDDELNTLDLGKERAAHPQLKKNRTAKTNLFAEFSLQVFLSIRDNENILNSGNLKELEKVEPVHYTDADYAEAEERDQNARESLAVENDVTMLGGFLSNMEYSDTRVKFGKETFAELERRVRETIDTAKRTSLELKRSSVRVPKPYEEEYKTKLEALKAQAIAYLDTKKHVTDPHTLKEGARIRYEAAEAILDFAERHLQTLNAAENVPDPFYSLTYSQVCNACGRIDEIMEKPENRANINPRAYAAWKITHQLKNLGEQAYNSLGYDSKQLERDITRLTRSEAMQYVYKHAKDLQNIPLKEFDEAYSYVNRNMNVMDRCRDQNLDLKTAENYQRELMAKYREAPGPRNGMAIDPENFGEAVRKLFISDCWTAISKNPGVTAKKAAAGRNAHGNVVSLRNYGRNEARQNEAPRKAGKNPGISDPFLSSL